MYLKPDKGSGFLPSEQQNERLLIRSSDAGQNGGRILRNQRDAGQSVDLSAFVCHQPEIIAIKVSIRLATESE
jgi:hypothetical protein